MADKKLPQFRCYAGNIRFFTEAATDDKSVFYYNDLVQSPAEMKRLFDLMSFEPAEGKTVPSLSDMESQWAEVAAKSRGQYDKNQAAGGGSKTKDAPLDFKFHQRNLTDPEKMKAWRYLNRVLTDEEFALLERFEPPAHIPKASLFQRIADFF
ncbi:hypothetical protein [Marivivens niveibacter]|nr:hypothetical protein [Marivivens niveibacter]